MPRSPKYSLEPLLEHRDRQVDRATTELGSAVRAREAADEARSRAERAARDAEARAEAVRAEEAERLARGELRAADLARAGAWEIAARAESNELSRRVARAAEDLEGARRGERAARESLAKTKADRDVVSKDRARFLGRARKAAEAAEEEGAEEAFRGSRRSS